MPQHTSSEVTVGYDTIRFKNWNLIMTIVKKLMIYRPISKSAGAYIKG